MYDLERKIIVETMEELKQQVTATAKKIERYDGCLKQYRENSQFQNKRGYLPATLVLRVVLCEFTLMG